MVVVGEVQPYVTPGMYPILLGWHSNPPPPTKLLGHKSPERSTT